MTFTDGSMNACGDTKIMSEKMTSLQKLVRRGVLLQHDDRPERTAMSHKSF